jgi:hypothetical protein
VGRKRVKRKVRLQDHSTQSIRMKSQKSELKVREREKDGGDSDARRGKGATHPSIFNPVLKHPSFYTKRENPNST